MQISLGHGVTPTWIHDGIIVPRSEMEFTKAILTLTKRFRKFAGVEPTSLRRRRRTST